MSSEAATARLFFALVPDLAVRRQLVARRRILRVSGRPVPAEQLHATLVFLGNHPRERIADLCGLAAAVHFPRLSLNLNLAGSFGRARVAWVGVDPLPDPLTDFRRRLVQALDQGGIRHDRRPWSFHLTLYRDLRTPYANMTIEPVRWAPRAFVLMESVSERAGPRYRVVGRWAAGECRGEA